MCQRYRITRPHHRRPVKQSLIIATTILLALFVFFPPFEFVPYVLQAEPPIHFVNVPEIRVPDPPAEVPDPPRPIGMFATSDVSPPTARASMPELNALPSPPAYPHLRSSSTGFIAFDEVPVPEYLANPEYPALAREAGIEGTVYLKVRIGVDHRVHAAVVLKSDVTPAMEKAAVEAALKCRYKPARQRSVEVEVWVPIMITFQLQ